MGLAGEPPGGGDLRRRAATPGVVQPVCDRTPRGRRVDRDACWTRLSATNKPRPHWMGVVSHPGRALAGRAQHGTLGFRPAP